MSGAETKRNVERKRTLKKGTIVFNNRYCSANCTVRNESETGALLVVSDNHLIPSRVELNVYPGAIYRPVQVMWRTKDAVGVKFKDVENSKAPDVPEDYDMADVVIEAAPSSTHPVESPVADRVERRANNLPDRRKSNG